MAIRLKRFPDDRLDFSVYSGVVTVEQALRHFTKLDASANWLSYFDATADLSAIDLGHYPALKRGLIAKEAERDSDELRWCLLVNAAPINDEFVRFWSAYAAEGIAHPHQRDLCPTLAAAFDRLQLPDDARAALAAQLAPGEPVAAGRP